MLEYMNEVGGQLPEGVTPTLGPDATGVGWVYEYALVDESGRHNLAQLRSFQDWYLKYWLEAVPGVAEVASIGGFVKQYQVDLDPNALLAYNIPIQKVIEAIRRSNNDVGGRVIEVAGTEHMVRGRGYITSVEDINYIPLGTDGNGTSLYVKDIAEVHLGAGYAPGIGRTGRSGRDCRRHCRNALW